MIRPGDIVWFFYEILFWTGILAASPHYVLRMRKRGGYRRNFGERFGKFSAETSARLAELRDPLWIHAVSVGEVQLAVALIAALRGREPGLQFLLTTTTSTGYAIAKEHEAAGLVVVYAPLDSRFCFGRLHARVQPRAIAVMEAEIWPNHLSYCARLRIPLLLINARISPGSFRSYRRFSAVFGPVFRAFELITLQAESDRARLRELGARDEAMRVIGSLKYGTARSGDERKREALLDDLAFLEDGPVLCGASTHSGEEEILVELWGRLAQEYPRLRLVLAPRHVERKPEITEMLERRHVDFMCRSNASEERKRAPVVLLDTTGDLRHVLELANVVFIGKSLRGRGGQNLLEPAWHGKPVVFGPHMENFRPIVEDFLSAQAAVQVPDEEGLERAVRKLLNGEGKDLGRRAKALVESKQDVLEKTVELVLAALDPHER